jgi:hypothetical protein
MPGKKPNAKLSNLSREQLTRRQFLNQAAGAGVVAISAPAIVRSRNLNDKLNLAIIGAGGRGAANLRDVETENIAILCDVNETGLNAAAQRHPKAQKIVISAKSTTATRNSTRWSSAPQSIPTPSPRCPRCNWANKFIVRSR